MQTPHGIILFKLGMLQPTGPGLYPVKRWLGMGFAATFDGSHHHHFTVKPLEASPKRPWLEQILQQKLTASLPPENGSSLKEISSYKPWIIRGEHLSFRKGNDLFFCLLYISYILIGLSNPYLQKAYVVPNLTMDVSLNGFLSSPNFPPYKLLSVVFPQPLKQPRLSYN